MLKTKKILIVSQTKDASSTEIRGAGKDVSGVKVMSLPVNQKATKYLKEKGGCIIFISARRVGKTQLEHYVPGKTKLAIKLGEEKMAERTIRHIQLIKDPLAKQHGDAEVVSKFWSQAKSKIPEFMFKITIDPVKKRKTKNEKS